MQRVSSLHDIIIYVNGKYCLKLAFVIYSVIIDRGINIGRNFEVYYFVKVKVKVKLRFSAPSAGIADIEQT